MDAATCAGQAALITQQHELIGALIAILTAMGAGAMVYLHTRPRPGEPNNA